MPELLSSEREKPRYLALNWDQEFDFLFVQCDLTGSTLIRLRLITRSEIYQDAFGPRPDFAYERSRYIAA